MGDDKVTELNSTLGAIENALLQRKADSLERSLDDVLGDDEEDGDDDDDLGDGDPDPK